MFAGVHDYTAEARSDEGRGDGQGKGDGGLGDRRGKVFASYAAEGRGDVRSDARGDLRGEIRGSGDAALEIGIGLGLGNGVSGGSSDRAEKQAHATGTYSQGGHALPAVFPAGSDGTSYSPSEGRSEHSSGLPFMMSYGPFDRRPESSYGGRGDDSSKGGVSGKNVRKLPDSDFEDTDSAGGPVNSNEEPNARTLKRPRLVWTPQLHKRFVDAVGHLGIKNAVPKTIMQLMNVEGLTRENVASHLQKYRLYLKRMQGLSSDSPPASDQLFASTPLPPSLGLHYLPKQRDDVGPASFPQPAVPMPFQGLGPLGPAHFSAYEHIPYSAMNRGLMQRPTMKDRSEHISESENNNHHSHIHHSHSPSQPSSPPKRLLSLFPTTSS